MILLGLLSLLIVAVVFVVSRCTPDEEPAPPVTQGFMLKDGTRCVSVKGKDVLVCDFAKPVGDE